MIDLVFLDESRANFNTDPRVNPFGPGARVDHEQWTISLGISWAADHPVKRGTEP